MECYYHKGCRHLWGHYSAYHMILGGRRQIGELHIYTAFLWWCFEDWGQAESGQSYWDGRQSLEFGAARGTGNWRRKSENREIHREESPPQICVQIPLNSLGAPIGLKKKYYPIICCLQETHFKDANGLKEKNEKIWHVNSNRKIVSAAITFE